MYDVGMAKQGSKAVGMPDPRQVTVRPKRGRTEQTFDLVPQVALRKDGVLVGVFSDMPSAWQYLAEQGLSVVVLDKHLDI